MQFGLQLLQAVFPILVTVEVSDLFQILKLCHDCFLNVMFSNHQTWQRKQLDGNMHRMFRIYV